MDYLIDKNIRDIDYPEMFKNEVASWVHEGLNLPEAKVYTVWFCFILGNAKGLFTTNIKDGRYYEVTLNMETDHLYIDTYKKTHQHDLWPALD